MKTRNIKSVILVLTFNLLASATLAFTQDSGKTILISDIDDTIKVGHIRSKIDAVSNAYRTNNIFLGMADLYRIIKNRLNADVFYLTNAPEEVMAWSHTELLKNGNFPEGSLEIRPIKVSSKIFKAQRLEELISEHRPDTVILVGDNGEHDNSFYNGIKQTYPGIKFHTFIRAAYNFDESNKLYKGQASFVTPFEIADTLYQRKVLERSDSKDLQDLHLKNYMEEYLLRDKGQLYTPHWQRCYGHKVNSWSNLFSTLPKELTKKISILCRNYEN
ncbi:phosphatase domain-containing protein [Halobacteriovorax sp. ZH4_bin.1]|uniref:phosphatase domain-containing protein n=1 Tax=unclassified Halobacteriovorax TaxID=2639665 RepID=UPI00372459C1